MGVEEIPHADMIPERMGDGKGKENTSFPEKVYTVYSGLQKYKDGGLYEEKVCIGYMCRLVLDVGPWSKVKL
jgi:hypothetical protein